MMHGYVHLMLQAEARRRAKSPPIVLPLLQSGHFDSVVAAVGLVATCSNVPSKYEIYNKRATN